MQILIRFVKTICPRIPETNSIGQGRRIVQYSASRSIDFDRAKWPRAVDAIFGGAAMRIETICEDHPDDAACYKERSANTRSARSSTMTGRVSGRPRWAIAVGILAVAFGIITVFEGGRMLFGRPEIRTSAGNIV